MSLIENFLIAFKSIKENIIRTIITILIITIGISSLVGILTAIDSINYSLNDNFSSLGANTFSIRNNGSKVKSRKNRIKKNPIISYKQGVLFKNKFDLGKVSLSSKATGAGTIKHNNLKTNPNIEIIGIDENYFLVYGYEIYLGRNINIHDLNLNSNVTVIGIEVAKQLFDSYESAIGKFVSINNKKLYIIGLIKEKGKSSRTSPDRSCFVPLTYLRNNVPSNLSIKINIIAESSNFLKKTIDKSIGIMRSIRKLKPKDINNFAIIKSDNLLNILNENLKYVKTASTIIGIITLIGAAIALMNIMLVSVTERTKEIGTRKALGATSKNILNQFLIEAILICQIGGVFGIIIGILIGNITSILLESTFIIPWIWIIFGLIICYIVGLISGIYPAIKASKLNPIEALRYD